jgi:hypothetical protein
LLLIGTGRRQQKREKENWRKKMSRSWPKNGRKDYRRRRQIGPQEVTKLHKICTDFPQLCLLKSLYQQYWRQEFEIMGSAALTCIACKDLTGSSGFKWHQFHKDIQTTFNLETLTPLQKVDTRYQFIRRHKP